MSIARLLGNHILFGGMVTTFAVIACLIWDYCRMERSGRFFPYLLRARRIAIALTVISAILIGARFASVLSVTRGL